MAAMKITLIALMVLGSGLPAFGADTFVGKVTSVFDGDSITVVTSNAHNDSFELNNY